MSVEQPLCCTTSVVVGQRAFNNYNGIGISLAYSPRPPSAAQLARGPSPPTHLLQPPPMLAVVLDASMHDELMQSATTALTQALAQLNPQTRLLLVVVDQVVSVVDLKTPRPQSWVLYGLNGLGPPALPQLVQAADVRATPLAHCQSYLAASIAALKHFPRQQSLQHHLRIMAAAADIALFLLTASMAAWDAQHKPTQQASTLQGKGSSPDQQQQPMHNTRVMVLTGLPNSSSESAAHAADQMHQLEDASAKSIRTLFQALARKASALDIPIDVITGSTAAPAALLFQEVVDATYGRLLYQAHLRPPLAANLAAVAQSRFGFEGVLDVRVPPGVKLLNIQGPVAPGHALPQVAYMSGTTQLPVVLLTGPKPSAAAVAATAAAAATNSSAAADRSGPAQAPAAGSSAPTAGTSSSDHADANVAVHSGDAGPLHWSSNAVAVPVMSTCTRFTAALQLSKDWPPGSSFELQMVCEWTAVDGRRVRQIVSHTVDVSDRLAPFMEGLDIPAVVLLTSQRLVTAAAAAAAGQSGSSGSTAAAGLRLAAEPLARSVEEARMSVGMALAHVAQRVGHAHLSRRGVFGWGSQQVWQLPDDLIPLALSFYQLQRGPLINSAAALAADSEWSDTSSSSSSTHAGDQQAQVPGRSRQQLRQTLMLGSWRVLTQQFMQCASTTALRMVAPWLYVFDTASGQFDVLPPLNLALEPDALAVLDCGSEVLIYVGQVITAAVEGLPTPSADWPSNSSSTQHPPSNGITPPVAPSVERPHERADAPTGLPVLNGTDGTDGTGGIDAAANRPAPLKAVPDVAEAAAPAVRCAQALVRGRVPVPAIHIVDNAAGMVTLTQRLVPLHEDPVALQMLLLPHLNDISPMQHGYLLDWHKHWAAVALNQQQQHVPYAVRAGGARLASSEAAKGQELSFGSWYSSFGVVLKSPVGALARGEQNIEVE